MNRMPSVEVALFARSPIVGQVKQRLATEIGVEKTLECYRALLQIALSATSQYSTTIWYEGTIEVWDQIAPSRRIRKQPNGDLGFRMLTALREGATLVVGADIPLLNATYIERAIGQLATKHDLVLGPTEDGGYCLVGMNQPYENLFKNIAWGSDFVLEQTLARAQELDVRVALLPKLWDVDTVNDYHRWKREMLQDQSSREQET